MQLFASLASKQAKRTSTKAKPEPKQCEYRAVEININHTGCCQAVQDIAGKRFLSDELPKLPLNDCDASECKCSFKLHDDRRSDIRRGSDVAFDIASQLIEHNQRISGSSGRRSND